MAQNLCLLHWDGDARTCDLAYGHPGRCSEEGVERPTDSTVGMKRSEIIQKQQAAIAEELARAQAEAARRARPLDAKEDCEEWLLQHFKTDKLVWLTRIAGEPPCLNNTMLPFHSLHHSSFCCGMLEIGNWHADNLPLSLALFSYWIESMKNGTLFSRMGVVSTTQSDDAQVHAENLLRGAGFVETRGFNPNSNHNMSIWVWKIHEPR